MKTVFLRALEADDKASALLAAIHEPEVARGRQRFDIELRTFTTLPRSPFAYWVSAGIRKVFRECSRFETGERLATRGASTCDDFRYVRLWTEVAAARNGSFRWVPFTKGGRFARFYAPIPSVVDWDDSRLTFRGFIGRPGRWLDRPEAVDKYFRPAITWPLRGIVFSGQAVPRGCIFSVGGKVAIVPEGELIRFLALFNSAAFDAFIRLYAGKVGGVQYEVGLIQSLPVPRVQLPTQLGMLARRAWSLKRNLDSKNEVSHAFTLPALLHVEGDTLAARVDAWVEHVRNTEIELAGIQVDIDARCFELYDIDEADRRAIMEGFGAFADVPGEVTETDSADDVEPEEEDSSESGVDATGLATELVSWAVEAAFGRFDMRLATGARPLPKEPEPFDRLPVCSPAMLTGDDGLPLMRAPDKYPVEFPENGILVDDRGHPRDLATAVRVVFDEIFKATADSWSNGVGMLLDSKDHDLRAWVASSFFEHHLKRYSKSRRKAPILWQLSVPSGHYSVWLYAQRLTRDSFFQVQNDVVTPKLAHEERQLTSLIHGAGSNPSAKERKEIAEQEAFVEELRSLLDEVKRVAPLWNPVLDDGVVLTMAPLWRLVPQHKPWQKELKSKWDELAAGKYDWSHAAMHLWPERVIPKCATDRSLAIAQGLEDVFWAEADDGTWEPRPTPKCPVDELVRERTSVAVKAALKGLIGASAPNGPKARARRS